MHPQTAFDLIGIKDVQRAIAVVGEEVGHIDQKADRAQANGAQRILQPSRARTILHTFDHTSVKHRTGVSRIIVNGYRDRAWKCARDWLNRGRFHCSQPARCKVERDTAHTQRVRAIGCDRDLNHRINLARIILGQPIHKRLSNLTRGQFDNAVMFVAQLKFTLGRHHTVAFDTADFAHRKRHIDAGHIVTGLGQHDGDPFPRIGRATHDLLVPFIGRHGTHTQTIRIRVLLGMGDFRQRKGFQLVRWVLNLFHLKTKIGQGVRDLIHSCGRIKVRFEPGQREFHGCLRGRKSGAPAMTKNAVGFKTSGALRH